MSTVSTISTAGGDADVDAPETFDAFYGRTRDRVALHIAALTGDRAEALDHVQEAYVRAWARWSRVGGLDDPEGWVRRVAYNLAVSRWRRARRTVLRADAGAADLAWDTDDGGDGAVFAALRRLPRAQREALALHHVVGWSVAEIAREPGAAEGTVKSWLSRGRARLAAELRPSAPAPTPAPASTHAPAPDPTREGAS